MKPLRHLPGRSPLLSSTAPTEAERSGIEFATIPVGTRLFGFSRSGFYEHHALGNIRLVTVRKPGKLKGRTLVDCESVRRFLQICAAGKK